MVLDTLAGTEFSWGNVCSFLQILREFHGSNKGQNHCEAGRPLPQTAGLRPGEDACGRPSAAVSAGLP